MNYNFNELYKENGFSIVDEEIQAIYLCDVDFSHKFNVIRELSKKYVSYLKVLKVIKSPFGEYLKQMDFNFDKVIYILTQCYTLSIDNEEYDIYIKSALMFIYTYIPFYYRRFILENSEELKNLVESSKFTKEVNYTIREEVVSSDLFSYGLLGKDEIEKFSPIESKDVKINQFSKNKKKDRFLKIEKF